VTHLFFAPVWIVPAGVFVFRGGIRFGVRRVVQGDTVANNMYRHDEEGQDKIELILQTDDWPNFSSFVAWWLFVVRDD
jgi:hypothetical protein